MFMFRNLARMGKLWGMASSAVTSKVRFYPKQKVARMMQRATQTIQDMREAEISARVHRAFDPFEQAKLFLRRKGIVVFAHSLHVQSSTLIVVGQRKMTEDEVIALADRLGQ